MNFWLTIVVAGLATFGIRYSFIWLYGRVRLPDWFRRSLRFVPVAVFAAIVFPEVLMPGGNFDFSIGNYHLLAGLFATFIAWRSKNAVITVAAGMVILWFLLALSNFLQ